MAQMSAQWVRLRGTRRGKTRRGLRCTHCGNNRLRVIEEPVARQVRSLTAHHLRVIAKCPTCGGVLRIKRGPSDQ